MNLTSVLMTGETAVNGWFDIIRTSKWWEQIINFFDKLYETNREGEARTT